MIKYFTNIFIGVLLLSSELVYAQVNEHNLWGAVSYLTSYNVYVRHDGANEVQLGDTLYNKLDIPCILVTFNSSSSIVGTPINNCNLELGDSVYFKIRHVEELDQQQDSITEDKTCFISADVNSKITLGSYSDFSSSRDDKHKLISKLSLDIKNIQGRSLNFSSRFRYKEKMEFESDTVSNTIFSKGEIVAQDLSVNYYTDSNYDIVLGRKINNRTSSLGVVDGLQFEKSLGKSMFGLIAGFRPDMYDYSFNSSLFEYGLYYGYDIQSSSVYCQASLGFLEQLNHGYLDRRYTYFQQSTTLKSNLHLFSSFEVDLFSDELADARGKLSLTNIYLSSRYRFNKKWSISASYDSRKRILFQETYKSEIEQLIDDNQARQGLRLRLNYKPIKHLYTGLSYSRRFQNDHQNKAENLYAFISYANIPKLGGKLSVNYNNNSSNYMNSNIFTYKYRKSILPNKFYIDMYYRNVDYDYFVNRLKENLKFFGANFSITINKQLMLSIFAEYSTSQIDNRCRINTKLVKRFNTSIRKN